ncbi:putative uncharacterized protein [Pseudarthrobacter siccitolerans]|uniref:HPt domain-containing protein n=1 Tax=Pseudarthrobacter siccitolerans TaxID=861266 RepID=A0A024GZ63_9MICC|nr:Hpt domain-containing protein [Pseudarthrobacter siccitolerans]CCQ45033.1 putative uncharacterized protein [Pseudarthrobacter siccitolerans]
MTPITSPFRGSKTPPEKTGITRPADAVPPLVDRLVLERLEEELDDGGEGYTSVFVTNFIACLPRRIERLRLTLTTGDWEGSFDAVLSLKTSSQMVGAEQLALLAMTLEAELRSDATLANLNIALPQQAATFLEAINQCSSRTVHSLTSPHTPGP